MMLARALTLYKESGREFCTEHPTNEILEKK